MFWSANIDKLWFEKLNECCWWFWKMVSWQARGKKTLIVAFSDSF
jgi:hypothetical protein